MIETNPETRQIITQGEEKRAIIYDTYLVAEFLNNIYKNNTPWTPEPDVLKDLYARAHATEVFGDETPLTKEAELYLDQKLAEIIKVENS